MSSEPEGIGQCDINRALLRLVEREVHSVVQCLVLVTVLVVDGRRYDVVTAGEQTEQSLHGTGSAQHVSCHRLGATDIHLIGMLAKDVGNGLSLTWVTHRRGGAVDIDVVHVFGLDASIIKCALHHQRCSHSLGVRSGDVISVGAHAATDDLAINLGTACQGVLEFLKDEANGTLAHDEAVT